MSLTVEKFKHALQLFENANYTESWNILNQVIQEDPVNDLALYLLGIIYYKSGNTQEAIKHLESAISVNPADDYIKDLADVYFDINDYETAIRLYKKVLENHPENLEILFNVGLANYNSKKYQEAVEAYTTVVQLNPDDYEALNNLGLSYYALDCFDKAHESFSKAVSLNKEFHEAYNNIGNVFKLQDKVTESIDAYKQAVRLLPDCPHYHYNLGLACYKANKLEEAISCYNKLLTLVPDNVDALTELSISYFHNNQLDEAINYAEKAIKIDPNSYKANFYAGISCFIAGKNSEAKLHLSRAKEIDPSQQIAHGVYGWTYLIEQNFVEGFKHHEISLDSRTERKIMADILDAPLWNGVDSLEGKTIYVFYELNYGDILQFARYIPLLHSLGANVIFQVRPGLEKLFEDSDLKAQIVPCLHEQADKMLAERQFNIDYHVPLWTLGAYFTKDITEIPYPEAYLKADRAKVNQYKKGYFDNDNYKIGLVWNCSNGAYSDLNRSLPDLSVFFPLAQLENVSLYSFQKGNAESQLENLPEGINIVNLGKTFNDFADTAAAIENLDLLISVDTSVAHLGGALGKETCILIQNHPEWRWFQNIEHSPWYKSVKLYRQSKLFSWEEPLNKLFEDIKAKIC